MSTAPQATLPASPPPAVLSALQAALAAENAAVFGYGAAGARMSGSNRAQAMRDWVLHERARDTLTAMLVSRGGQPAPAAPGYSLPFTVRNSRAGAALAAYLEDRVATAYLELVALADPRLRAFGAGQVRAAALRAAAWRGGTLAFPGLQPPPTQQAPG